MLAAHPMFPLGVPKNVTLPVRVIELGCAGGSSAVVAVVELCAVVESPPEVTVVVSLITVVVVSPPPHDANATLASRAAASAALLSGLAAWKSEPWDRAAIAELGRRVEVEDLGVAGGRQDHYAATHGGALALTFTTTTGRLTSPTRRTPTTSPEP